MDPFAILRASPLFESVSEKSLSDLAARARFKELMPGEVLIRYGEPGRMFGVVLEGELEASRPDPEGGRVQIGLLKPGDSFGEMSLLTGDPTSAELMALIPGRVLWIAHESMQQIIAREPTLMAALARVFRKRLEIREKSPEEQKFATDARRASEDPYDLRSFSVPGGGRILTINCGSSSVKYRLFDSGSPVGGMKGLVDRIGIAGTRHVWERGGKKTEEAVAGQGYVAAFEAMVEALGGELFLMSVDAVGHRVVIGGEKYSNAVLIDDQVLADIRACEKFAPLHIPANVAGIEQAKRLMPKVPHVAVFDTGFHRTLPRHAYLYAIPYEMYEKNGIRRFGFHGMSHQYVSLQAATTLRRPVHDLRLISCHLGNGASVAAIDHGRSVDTSMGMTPLEGLVMGTRSGDLDPGTLLHIMKEKNLSPADMEKILMRESGLLGLSGLSSDSRELETAAAQGNDRARLAIQVFCYRVKKYVGAYMAVLGGVDALIFTAGIGERSPMKRALACQGLAGIGLVLDEERNRSPKFDEHGVAVVSTDDSPAKILVVQTDEERMIARETSRAITRDKVSRVMRSHDRVIPIGVSAHHVHLSREHVEALFGAGHRLTTKTPLSMPGQFACMEQVTLVGPKGKVQRVRILGPERKASQVEISRTEEFMLGIDAPIRMSGDLDGSPGLTMIGTQGSVALPQGVICAQRHIHMQPEDALGFGLRDKDVVAVQVEGPRSLIFGDVVVRVDPSFRLEMHLDTDEANAAEVNSGMKAHLTNIQSRR